MANTFKINTYDNNSHSDTIVPDKLATGRSTATGAESMRNVGRDDIRDDENS